MDTVLRKPDNVQHAGHACQQVAEQQRGHVGTKLRVEDVTLAVELLQASTVAKLANRDVKYAKPDEVDCDQGQGGEPNDNLSMHNKSGVGPRAFGGNTHSKASGLAILESDVGHCQKLEIRRSKECKS